jgi:hypothetical protein
MLAIDYDGLRDTPVATDPFAHVVVPRFIPPASLRAVLADLPPIAKRGSFPPDSLRLGPDARALVEALQGPTFRALVAERFDLDLADSPTMLTIRGRTEARDGRIHCDSIAKLVTILLYLNPGDGTFAGGGHEGHLRLLRGPDDIEDYAVEVPPTDGTLLVFPNGPTTWHGHRPFVGQRYAIQLNYMASDSLARSEMRRHRFSAFVKRLTAAA